MQITRDNLIESLESTANFCRGASLDPAIPALVKGALQARAKEIDAITDAALKDGGVDGMTFGLAVEALKVGKKVARTGWNGKGMFVYLVPAAAYLAATPAAKSYFGDGALVPYNAYMAIKNVDETVSTWVPSVNDCLAEDWLIVE